MAADSPNQPQAPTPVVNAVAPDPAKCRAEALFPGSRTARCLAEQSQTYRFFVTLDHRAMCSHPQDVRIVARTLAGDWRLAICPIIPLRPIPFPAPISILRPLITDY